MRTRVGTERGRALQREVTSDAAQTADDILRRGADLWIWQRRLRAPLADAVDTLATGACFDVRAEFEVRGRGEAVEELLVGTGIVEAGAAMVLAQDVASLSFMLGRLLGAPRVRVRIECNDGGLCPLFHVDATGLRLICTYRGPGTEWVPGHLVRRDQLGLQGRTPEAANAAIAPGPDDIRELQPGWVGIFKGSERHGDYANGVVHRSPQRPGRRLLVVLDAPRPR